MEHISKYFDLIARIASHSYLVFDGKPPLSKMNELAERERSRETYGIQKKSPEIVNEIIEKYRNNPNFTIVVAPQESDPQLAYMSLKGIVDYVITEDSDLIVYGCDRILFKLKPSGLCMVYKREKMEEFIKLHNWDFQTFKFICILCGCDYMRGGIKGLGFKRATTFFTRSFGEENELKDFLKKTFGMGDDDFQVFKRACDSFMNQLVQTRRKIGPYREMIAE